MKIGIIDLCKQIEDPRMNRKKVHKMETIIYQGRRIIFFTIFSFVISLLYCWLLTYYHLLMSIIFLIFIRYIKT